MNSRTRSRKKACLSVRSKSMAPLPCSCGADLLCRNWVFCASVGAPSNVDHEKKADGTNPTGLAGFQQSSAQPDQLFGGLKAPTKAACHISDGGPKVKTSSSVDAPCQNPRR